MALACPGVAGVQTPGATPEQWDAVLISVVIEALSVLAGIITA
jgi:hypothetical protein